MPNTLLVFKRIASLRIALTAVVMVFITSSFAQQTATAGQAGSIDKAKEEVAGKLVFIENKGQWPGHVLFRADFPGGQMLATPQGMLIGKYDDAGLKAASKYEGQLEEIEKGLNPVLTVKDLGPAPVLRGHGWRFNFLGGNLANSESMERKEQASEYFNFFIGAPSTFATNVHGYSELIYKDVYKGVDVRYYNAPEGGVENDIIIYPGADAAQVKIEMEGVEQLRLSAEGTLILPTTVGDMEVPAPVGYLRDVNGVTSAIAVKYVLTGKNTLGFAMPAYDKSKTLVIDPIVMRWATWISGNTGSSDAHNHGIDLDAAGYIYDVGKYGNNLITVGAFQTSNLGSHDVYISKYAEPAVPGGAGQRVWQTYMGTTADDNPYAMNVGPDGNLYIVGMTGGNFNRTYGSGAPASSWATQRTCGGSISQQGWVAKVSPAGTWALVREIGPASANYYPTLWDLRIIPTTGSNFDVLVAGNVTQQSNTADGDVPAATLPDGTAKTGTGDDNGYVFRISSDLNTLLWTKQFTSSGNNDDQFNIASVDNSGNIYLGGVTYGTAGISYNNPSGQTTRVGSRDGWLMKLNGATGSANWSRYFNASSGSTYLTILCMEFNRAKTNLIVGGLTTGAATYNITTSTAYGGSGDFVIASLPASGAATNWGTYYGGNQQEYNMMGLNVDQNDDIYVLGYTYSKNITTVNYPLQDGTYNNNTGERQAVFFKLLGTTGGTVLYNTFMGGSGDDYDPLGERGIKFNDCRIYLCVTAVSNDFPLTAGTLTSTKSSGTSTLDPLLISMSNPPDMQGQSITGGGTQTIVCGQAASQITAGAPSYLIPTIIRNNVNQTNGTSGAFPNGVPTITNIQWQISVDTGYTWTNIPGATSQNYSPGVITTAGLVKFRRIVNGDACNRTTDTSAVANVTVNPTSPSPTISNNGPLCAGATLQLTANTVAGATYYWTGPNGFTSTLQNPTISNVTTAAAGAYKCILITTANGCPSYASTTNVVITARPAAPTAGSNSPVCAGQTLNLTATGDAGATYAWTGPNAFTSTTQNPFIANVTTANAGNYFVTQTVAGCTSSAASVAVIINATPAPTGVSATPNPVCSGQTLTLTATAAGGATLNWTFPDGGTATGSPVTRTGVTTAMAGTYSVTQTASGCVSNPATVAVVINQTPAAPVASNNGPLCSGQALNLSATGAGGASFAWTGPNSYTSNLQNPVILNATAVNAGLYSVTQTVSGCTSASAGTTTVTINPLPVATATAGSNKYCSGATLSLSASATGGTAPYIYSWTGPAAFTSSAQNPTRSSVTTAMSGIYSVLITDSKGCSANASTVFVTVNASPSVSATSSNSSYCSSATINLFATPTVGPAPYTYSWSGPAGFTSSVQNPVINNANTGMAGVYTVLLTDSNGCTATGSTSTIVIYSSPTVTANSASASYCSGATINLSSAPVGGTAPYSYAWSGSASFTSSLQNPTRSNSTVAMGGSYTVTITDNHSCTASASTVAVVVYQSPTVTASSSSSSYCESTTIQLNATPTSGTTPYSFSWSGPSSFSSSLQNPTRANATPAMSGIYTVLLTDAHSCTATANTGTITVNPGLAVTTNSNSPVCAGGNLNLYSSSTGGTLPLSYSWAGPSFTSALQNPVRSGASAGMAGSYNVTVSDVNGCSGTATAVVVVNPATSVLVSSNSQVCVGNTLTLQATPSGGTSPFTYVWAGPASFSASIANPSRTNSQLSYAGTYSVTATDINGCSGTGNTSVVINPLPAVTASATSPGYCVNSTIQLNATPSLGTAPYTTYNWSGPASYTSNQQNPAIANATTAMAGNYSVTLLDSKGCSATSSVAIAIYTNPIVAAGAGQTSCSGENVTLGGSPTASGANPPFTYVWNNGAANISNPVVNPTTATTYTVTVTDNRSCTATASTIVSVNAKPVANAGVDKTIPSCSLVGTGIGGSPTASGGSAPYSYSWSPLAGLSSSTTANPNVTGIGATSTYTVTVTDFNGCTASDAVIVNVTGSSLALNITANNPTAWCAAGTSNVTLTAGVTGGTTPYSYNWIGTDLSSLINASTVANPSIAGTYLYTAVVTDATGCQAGDTISIVVYPKPSADAGAADYYICQGASVTIGGSPTALGGTAPFSYAWNNGGAIVANPVVTPSGTTTYTVTVTDSHTCTATAASTVNVRSNPVANAGNDVNLPGCSPTGIAIGGSPTASGGSGLPYSYAWSPAAGLSSTLVSNPMVQGVSGNNTYTVTVSDANGCSSTDAVIVHVISNTPDVLISADGLTAWCAGSGTSVNLTANVTGGTLPFTYSWNGSNLSPLNTQTATANPSVANSYNYVVTVTDAFNCTATATKTVTVNANPTASAGAENYTICNGQSVVIGGNPTANGGTAPYTYNWNGGAAAVANPSVNPASTFAYLVTVYDANNCSATATTNVTVRTNPAADAGADKTMPGCTPTGLQIGGSPTAAGGGGGPYGYAWSPAAGLSSTSIANPFVAGIATDATYTVVVTDVNGCTASDQMVMHIISNTPLVNITASGSTAWCAGSNSSVNLTANITGGTGPFSYSWGGTFVNPVNSQVATVYPNSAGAHAYVVTVTDAYNCSATAIQTVQVNEIPVVNAGEAIHNICSSTSVTIGGAPTASGGVAPYTYAWNSGANAVANPVVTPLTSTTYIVTVTDSVGCSASAATTVLVRTAVHADAGADRSIYGCANACTFLGSSPTGFGGQGTLTYAWSPATGLSSTTVANPQACGVLATTFYTVTVTDTSGCVATDQIMITVTPSSLTAEAGTGGAFCLASGDSVMLGGYPTAVGGVPPYTYTWSPNTGLNLMNPANPVAYPTDTLLYSLTVTDALGCMATDTTLIRTFPLMFADAGTDTTICEGSPVVIGGSPSAWGGSGSGYTYVWSPATNINNITYANPVVSPFTSTDYSVTATDGNGCTATDHVIIHVRPNPVAQAGADKTITNCPLESVTIGESPAATGGNPPYTYAWSPLNGLSSSVVANPVVSGINSTTSYLLTVTDSYGCSSADNMIVNVVPSTLQAYQGGVQTFCSGTSGCVQLGGLPTVVGGVSPYTYTWSNTASLSNPASSNPIACPVVNTTYGLTVTDSKGCTVSASETVVVKPGPVANAGNDTAICYGQPAILGGTPTGTGGSGAGFTYTWQPASGISSATVANPVANATITTTYTVVVTDANGCSANDEITVTVHAVPVADAGADKNLFSCPNDTIFIGNIPAVSGGTAPYTYQWTPAIGLSNTTTGNPLVAGLAQTTAYQLQVTDSFGCTGIDNVIVNVYPQTLQAEAGNAHKICAAAGTPVNLGSTPTALGGTPPYTYSWLPTAGLSSAGVPNPVATVSVTTTYYLTVTDAKGCVAVDSVTITQNPSPIANAGADTALCAGLGKVLGGMPTASGGTGAFQYSWTPTTGLSANNTSNPSAYPQVTTTYEVLITDSNGCQASDAITITIYSNPVADAGLDKVLTACGGDSVFIGGSPSASGGAGGYTYQWSPATGVSDITSANPVVAGITGSSLYALTVTDANSCSAADVVFVSVVSSNLTANAGVNTNICAGAGSIVTLGGMPTAVGGTAPYSYNWVPSASLNFTDVSNPFATPMVTTTYFVTVTDGKGCMATDSVVVHINPAPIANAGADAAVCGGGTITAGGNPTAVGGAAPYIYSWSPSIGVSNASASNPVIVALTSSTYTVVVTDALGCTASDNLVITLHQNPIADAGADQTLIACSGDSVMIGGSPSANGGTAPYTYSWSPAAGLNTNSIANPFVSHLGSSTIYTLVVEDMYGCSATDQVYIAVTNSTLFAEAGNDVTVCQGAFSAVTLGGLPTATGGTPSYNYAWFPAAGLSSTTVANPQASPTQSTIYTVVVTDGSGCMAVDTVKFTVNEKPLVTAGANDTICQGTCVTLGGTPTASGAQSPYTYSWLPTLYLSDASSANPVACPAVTVTYTVTVTDQNGCSNSGSVNIKVNANPVADAGGDKTVVSCKNACVVIGGSPTASGGAGGYSYYWAPASGMNNPSIANPQLCNLTGTHVYGVWISDANGCTATDQVTVQAVASDLTADAGPDKTTCAGQNNCITIGGTPAVMGGLPPFQIVWSPVTGFCNSNLIANPDVNPVGPTTYALLVRDANGCVSVDSMNVLANPAVTAIVAPDTAICFGTAAILGGSPTTGSGGTAPYTYAWSPTAGIANPSSGNPSATPQNTTTYCVTVTDVVGCSASTCQSVTVNPQLFADAGTDKTITGCANTAITLGGSPAASGGSGDYEYLWSPATGLDSVTIANPTVTGLGITTVYTLQVKDHHTGCTSSDQVLVTVIPSTLSVEAGVNKFICPGSITGVQIGGLPTVSGGQGPFVYQWTPAAGLSDSTIANPVALPVDTTIYYLSVTDALGCVAYDSVTVAMAHAEVLSITGLNPKYCVDAGNVNLTATPAGGTFSGVGVTGNVFRPSVAGVGVWCITYTYTNPFTGCMADTVVCVTVDSLPALSITGYSPSYCQGDTAITLSGSPLGGIFTGNGIVGNVFHPALASVGDNVITYTYNDTLSGCSNSIQVIINVKEAPALNVSASEAAACPDADVSLSATYSLNVFNVIWADADGNVIYSGLNPVTVNPTAANHCYVATAVNTPGCISRDTICIQILDCGIHAMDEPCDVDSTVMNTAITVDVLANDTLPYGSDTTVTITTVQLHGSAVVNADRTVTFTPEQDFAGNVQFSYLVCVTVNGWVVCDTADVCITVVDTTITCHFPNTITPNEDGVNDDFEVSCNDAYPDAAIRIYDRWGAEVFRSSGHYDNKWNGYNQQGIQLPDGTYFYIYYFNVPGKNMKKGFIDVFK